MQNDLKFFIESDLIKSTGGKITKEDEIDYENMILEGIASDSEKDIQGESLNPKGFDLTTLKKVNWNHGQEIIGEVLEAKIISGNKLYVKARLLSSIPENKKLYENAWQMQNDPKSKIRLNWSVEGHVTERDPDDPGKVIKILITQLALTNTPVNYKNTFAECVRKSLGENMSIVENDYTDIQKAIIIDSSINSDLKKELFNLDMSIDEYTDRTAEILNINPYFDNEKCHEIMRVSKSCGNIQKAINLFITASIFDVIPESILNPESLESTSIKKALVYFNLVEAGKQDFFEKVCNKMKI